MLLPHMPLWTKFTILALLLLAMASRPLAKEPEQRGAIAGFIRNESGPIAGASVEANNLMTGATAMAVADATGYYRIAGLRPGRYSLWIAADRHRSIWIPKVIVEAGQTARQDAFLAATATLVPTAF